MGAESKAFIMSKLDGNIDVWKNKYNLQSGNKISLNGHSSLCSTLSISADQTKIYSTGSKDGMIIEWSLDFFTQSPQVTSAGFQKIEKEIECINCQLSDL